VEERRAKRQLWDDVRVAKERLSRHPAADLLIPLADVEVHLTRPELEVLAEPILAQAVRVTEALLGWANLAEGRIAGVFLVGGSSRIPLMSTQLFRALGEAPVVIEQPELVVAEGSILAGALTVGVEAPAAPGPTTGLLPRIPADAWGAAGPPSIAKPGEIPATASPASPASPQSPAPASPSAPPAPSSEGGAPISPAPWVGRVAVPGAQPPGRGTVPGAQPPGRLGRVAAVAPTRPFPVQAVAEPATPRQAYRQGNTNRQRNAYPQRRVKRRGRVRRAILALFITLLLVAVPVVAGVVVYSLVIGEGLLPDFLQTKLGGYP
jgi:molecular chaperone DnaK